MLTAAVDAAKESVRQTINVLKTQAASRCSSH
jgi:hypothetical protein